MRQPSFLALLALPLATFAQPIGLFDRSSDIGPVLHPGTASYDSATKTYTLSGSGDNMWAASDGFHYVWKRVSGDVTLEADIQFLTKGGNAHKKGVLMIRQDLDQDSAYVDAAMHGDGLTSLQSLFSAMRLRANPCWQCRVTLAWLTSQLLFSATKCAKP